MKKYYFYFVDYRKEQKQNNIISFELKALYAETAFSGKEGKKVTSFRYFDEVNCRVKTNTEAVYHFKFNHGTDNCTGHWAKSYHELESDLEKYRRFKPISEKNYMRLRRLAVILMFRHTKFFNYSIGDSEFFYSIQSNNFYNVELTRLMKSNSEALDTSVTESIDIFLPKPNSDGSLYQAFRFSLEANNAAGIRRYQTKEEAQKSIFFDRKFKQATLRNYERLRKFCLLKIWNHYELEISKLKEKQNYTVRIFDF